MHILLTFKVTNQRHMGNSMLNPILAICVATSPQPQKKSWSLYNWCLFCHGQESRPRCTDISIICQAEAQRRFRTLDMKRQGRGSSVAAMSLRLLCLIQFQTIFLLLVVLLHVQTLCFWYWSCHLHLFRWEWDWSSGFVGLQDTDNTGPWRRFQLLEWFPPFLWVGRCYLRPQA